MAGLIGIIVGAAALLVQFAAIRASGLESADAAEAAVRACAASGVLASWIAIDRADRRAGSPSSRTLVALPVTALLVALVAVKAMPRILAETETPMYAGGVAAVLAGGAAGALAAYGRGHAAAGLTVLLTAAGEQAASLAAGRTVWLALPIGFAVVLAGIRFAGRAAPLPVALAAGAPVLVAALVAAAGSGVAGEGEPVPWRLGWLAAGCALAAVLALSPPAARRIAAARVRPPGGVRAARGDLDG
ncbi:hypothetical protein [Spirillospora albida]|uniref:hypothetical protein n=1 Tax=Spirillospora albida TaxID=58123 RepID=UPI0004C103E4|nr:hypothetical protein [Spirillospora albida]